MTTPTPDVAELARAFDEMRTRAEAAERRAEELVQHLRAVIRESDRNTDAYIRAKAAMQPTPPAAKGGE